MLKSAVKRITIAFSSFAAVLTASQGAFAQLNVGNYGVQPGLESSYLQYQLSGQKLSRMRGIPVCRVGFGVACNKTGAVLEQLLESKGGASYQDLLMQAAGGAENFQNFASFYGNNPNLPQVPYASFWHNNSPLIVDGYQYLLGGLANETPVAGLGAVTKNFYWSPREGTGDSLDLRSGLLNLKYSYGRLLLEEVAKIPNLEQQIEQQIQSLGLTPSMTKFYVGQLQNGLQALKAGNETLLQERIQEVLSIPYFPDSAEYGRPNIGIPREFDELIGAGLPGDVFAEAPLVVLEPEVRSFSIPSNLEGDVLVQERSRRGFPVWLIGGGGLALMLLLLSLGGGEGGGDSSSGGQLITPGGTSGSNVQPNFDQYNPTPNGNGSDYNPITEVPSTTNGTVPPGEEVKKVLEPSTLKALMLLVIILCVVRYTRRSSPKAQLRS